MTRAGERLLRGADQALAYARGIAQDNTYRVHNPEAYRTKSTTGQNTSDNNAPVEQSQINPNGKTTDAQLSE